MDAADNHVGSAAGNGRFTDPDYELPGTQSYADFGVQDADLLSSATRRPPPLSGLFARGNDLESAHTSHTYTPAEKRKLQGYESIDYFAPSSRVYRRWLSVQPWSRYWDRWLVMAAIGIAVGAVGFTLHFLIHALAFIKYHGTRWLLGHAHISIGWVFNVSYSLALVYASTWLVVNIAPAASGAGVAEVMAYLNGCNMPKVMNLKTLGVKFLSAAFAVGSGLPVGPEGPMIHIGATIAAGLSQGHSTTLGCDTGLFRRFQNPKDKRDFVTAGAAVGVATAFSAPIGGLLFMFEEVASFWQQALGWQIFFACMLAVLTQLDALAVGDIPSVNLEDVFCEVLGSGIGPASGIPALYGSASVPSVNGDVAIAPVLLAKTASPSTPSRYDSPGCGPRQGRWGVPNARS